MSKNGEAADGLQLNKALLNAIQEDDETFSEFCIAHLYGRTALAGRVTPYRQFGHVYARFEIPCDFDENTGIPKRWFTTCIEPAAIFDFTPTDEKSMLVLARHFNYSPVDHWTLKSLGLTAKDWKELLSDDEEVERTIEKERDRLNVRLPLGD